MVYYDQNIIASQLVSNAVAVFIIDKLKKSSYVEIINENTYKLNKFVAIVTAGLVAIGINYSYSYTPVDGTLVLTVTGLTAMSLIGGLKGWILSYVTQQGIYRVSKLDRKGFT